MNGEKDLAKKFSDAEGKEILALVERQCAYTRQLIGSLMQPFLFLDSLKSEKTIDEEYNCDR